jgi:signal transduction histidine kinase
LNLSLVKPKDLFEEVLLEIKPIISARSLKINLDIQCNQTLLLDKERIQRVLHNLIENSRKALPVNGNIRIRSRQEAQVLALSIADDGVGMSEEILHHIFEPFYTQSSQGGTGLGMMIAKNIVEAHQGSITVDSKEDKGTMVTIRLPLTTQI